MPRYVQPVGEAEEHQDGTEKIWFAIMDFVLNDYVLIIFNSSVKLIKSNPISFCKTSLEVFA